MTIILGESEYLKFAAYLLKRWDKGKSVAKHPVECEASWDPVSSRGRSYIAAKDELAAQSEIPF